MAVMDHLLHDHPRLLPFAHDLNVALDWAGKIARAHGLTPEEAAKRLETAMVYDQIGGDMDGANDDDG